jgi:hypothetical protein
MWFSTVIENGFSSDLGLFDIHLLPKLLKLVGYALLTGIVFLLMRRVLALHALARLVVPAELCAHRTEVVRAGEVEAVKVKPEEVVAIFIAHLLLLAGSGLEAAI